ncbi:hypothetical protein RQP46_008155 [Phenoliferia psychrophenolica]
MQHHRMASTIGSESNSDSPHPPTWSFERVVKEVTHQVQRPSIEHAWYETHEFPGDFALSQLQELRKIVWHLTDGARIKIWGDETVIVVELAAGPTYGMVKGIFSDGLLLHMIETGLRGHLIAYGDAREFLFVS